jgi:hypothetical protein
MEAVRGEVRRVGVVAYVVQWGYDWSAKDIQNGNRSRGVESRVYVDSNAREGETANEN